MRQNQLIWFISSSVLGVLFILWASLAPALPLIPGDIWLLVPGFLMLFLGFLGIFDLYLLKRSVRNYLQKNLLVNESISLADLSTQTNFTINELRELIHTMRLKGELQVHFEENTGKIVKSDCSTDGYCKNCGEPKNQRQFCSVCGLKYS